MSPASSLVPLASAIASCFCRTQWRETHPATRLLTRLPLLLLLRSPRLSLLLLVPSAACTCDAGFISKDGYCWSCPAGTYQPGLGASSCSKCPLGEYSARLAAAACLQCRHGKTTARTGATSPSACSVEVEPGKGDEAGAARVVVLPGSYLVNFLLVIAAAAAGYYFRDEVRSFFGFKPREAAEGGVGGDVEMRAQREGTAPLVGR